MSYKLKPSVMGEEAVSARREIFAALTGSPIPSNELLRNLGLYLLPMDVKRFLFFDSIYRQIVNQPGIICEFGCRWGQNMAVLQSLRAVYEPFNSGRLIVGFDTFTGLTGVSDKDGASEHASQGAYSVSADYTQYLNNLLRLKETQSALPRLERFRVIKGDASRTFAEYLKEHPETIVSFAYFDMDIYEPTLNCLKLLKRHLTKGSIVGFDEINDPDFPGETLAFQEAIGANAVRLQRNLWCGPETFFVFE